MYICDKPGEYKILLKKFLVYNSYNYILVWIFCKYKKARGRL